MRKAIVVACVLAAGFASPVLAANARHPYANCDRKIDNCGPTGDNVTDQLNAQQLSGGGMPGAQSGPGVGAAGGPGYGGQDVGPSGGPGYGGPGGPGYGGPGGSGTSR